MGRCRHLRVALRLFEGFYKGFYHGLHKVNLGFVCKRSLRVLQGLLEGFYKATLSGIDMVSIRIRILAIVFWQKSPKP